MKKKYSIHLITLILIISSNSFAQKSKKIKTAEFKVKGICGMCKDRIEEAALIKGVNFAEWNKETDNLKVVYKIQKVSIKEIHQSIANVGHDTDLIKASDEAYSKIHECCKYREIEKH